ncbi:MAG: topoisomerase DNA-binding C4 zinc finger domain-containing protein, partial [Clostridia bacterium]|nr:topoisomerase DNA-binding C4 zinc finger domain-containing protein [Clostridia bacterium]
VEVAPELTDLICEKCGSRMVLRVGRFGKFAACPNYPSCKNTKSLTENEEEVKREPVYAPFRCEKCGAQMVLRTGRYGSFYACTGFPSCTFTKQKTQEADVKCPRCGGKLLTRYSRSHIPFYSCENYPQCQFSSWDKPTEEVCPKCGKTLFIKKSKKQLYCRNRTCDYTRPMPSEDAGEAGDGENKV